MTQENQVTPSNTNTAARELPSNDHLRLHLGEMTAQEMRTAKAAYRLALTETLTQQQGGEQEVGALVGKWRRLASYEDEEGELEVGSESAVRLIRCADELEAALLAKSAAYDALVAEIARAPVGKVEVYDTPEQWRYVIVPDHFDSGQRVRLLLVREGGDA